MEYTVYEPLLSSWIAFQSEKDARTYIGTVNGIHSTPGLSDWQKRERLDMLLAALPHRILI